jgi:mono/diheme cytochrome c family protein
MTVRIMMGIGNMPAYQEILNPGELDLILAYIHWAAGQRVPPESP